MRAMEESLRISCDVYLMLRAISTESSLSPPSPPQDSAKCDKEFTPLPLRPELLV